MRALDLGVPAVEAAAWVCFAVLWGIVGWSDLRHKKIRHRPLAAGLLAGAAGYAALAALTLLGRSGYVGRYHEAAFYWAAASGPFLSAAAALALWRVGVWPAGDAKLFTVLAALYPLLGAAHPQSSYQWLFLSALINTFIPASALIFVSASRYVYQTRLRHTAALLRGMGSARAAAYFRESLGRAAGGWLGAARLRERAARAWAGRGALALSLARSLLQLSVASLASCYLREVLDSPLALTLFAAAAFLLWDKAARAMGRGWAAGCALAGAAALLWLDPIRNWDHFWLALRGLTLFGAFTYLGMSWMMRLLSGGEGVAFLVPLAMPLVGGVMAALARQARGAGALAAMGLLFGLSLVMVRLWEEEAQPKTESGLLKPRDVVAPAFLDRLRRDPGFYERHFSTVYPDGLTEEQAGALRAWCAARGVDLVPVSTTVSFASWIFLGFLISRLLGGGHVLESLL